MHCVNQAALTYAQRVKDKGTQDDIVVHMGPQSLGIDPKDRKTNYAAYALSILPVVIRARGRRVVRPPPLSQKQFFLFTQENIFVFMSLSVKV